MRSGRVHGQIALVAGVTSAAGSFVGGVASKWTSERLLLLLFGLATLLVLAMMFLPGPNQELEEVSLEKGTVSPVLLSLCSLIIGILIGFLGAGNFVFVPLLIYVLKIPRNSSPKKCALQAPKTQRFAIAFPKSRDYA